MNGFQFKPGDTLLDGYTVERPLGHGGFGEVYHARSAAGKDVALKLIQRFLEVELRGVGHCLNLKHPHLVTIYDVRPDSEGRQWIVMEYVAGESLSDAVQKHPDGMPVEEALRWFEPICQAVEHLHQSGIVHRDLKPGNIFDDRGTVKVGDYGLAKFITASKRSAQTQSVGTLHYMAPEVGSGRYGREVDVYAVGIILYEMLTGSVPFDGETPAEILMKHLTSRPDLEKLPVAFRGVVARMLAKNPNDRYGSLGAVLADLRVKLADAAHAEAIGEPSQYPAYDAAVVSRAGASDWLEAPFAFLKDLGKGLAADNDRPLPPLGRSAPVQPANRGFGELVREHPLPLVVAVVVLTFFMLVAASGGRGPSAPIISLLVVSGLVVGALVWLTRFLDAGTRPRISDRNPFEPGRFASNEDDPREQPVHHGPTEPWRPLSGSEIAASGPQRERPLSPDESLRRWAYALGSLFMALCLGLGLGLLAAGMTFLMMGRDGEEAAAFFGAGAGMFSAGLILSRRLRDVHGPLSIRILIPLLLGGGTGTLVAGLMVAAFGNRGEAEEAAMLFGLGAGFSTAAAVGWGLRPSFGHSGLIRLLVAVFWGGGVGAVCAAFAMGAFGRHSEEMAAFFGVGAGFLTTGVYLCRLVGTRAEFPGLRLLASLLVGGGVGLLSAGLGLAMTNDEDTAGFLGAGAGFFTCGLVAWHLFTNVLPGVHARS